MPAFQYTAIDHEGNQIQGVILASNEDEGLQQLKKQTLIPIKLEEKTVKRAKSSFSHIKIKNADIANFTKQLQTLLKAGIPLVNCLNVLKKQTTDPDWEQIISLIACDVEQGGKFSDALAKFPKAFTVTYINCIKVAEVSGGLEDILTYLYEYIKQADQAKQNVKKALRYPLFVLFALGFAFVIFMTMVVPNFLPLFGGDIQTLPLPTRILIKLNTGFTEYGIHFLLILTGIVLALYFYYRSPGGRLKIDKLLLHAPLIGQVLINFNLAVFTKLFFTMNHAGIPIIETIKIIQESIQNKIFRKELVLLSEKIRNGYKMASSLEQSPYFSSSLVEMIAIGEKSGSLDEMLKSAADYYDNEVSTSVESMTAMMEPIITAALGIIVLFLASALFLPMWDIIGNLK